MKEQRFNNINLITILAMFMLYNIHFFNNFYDIIRFSPMQVVANILRGFSLIAVILFLANTAYTSVYLEKPINYRRLLIYIIVPTLLFAQLSHYLFNSPVAQYNFSAGFTGSWYGEMYVYVMLCLPLVMVLHKKNKNITLLLSIIFLISGYGFSIIHHTATAMNLGLLMVFPYTGLVYLLYTLIFRVEIDNMKNMYNLILSVPFLFLEVLAYSGFFSNKYYITSYFSPISILFAVLLFKFLFNLNIPKLNYRVLSQASYFFYFTHYIVIDTYKNYTYNFTKSHLMLLYFLGLILAYLLAYVIFRSYDFVVAKVLHL